MQKISTLILSDEYSTEQVLKLFISEFDNVELLESAGSYSQTLRGKQFLLSIYL